MSNTMHSTKIQELAEKLINHAASIGRPMRSQQLEYMHKWMGAILNSANRFSEGDVRTGITLSSADTGLGKTLGYALPLFALSSVTGHHCAIATHSHALQRQILDGDIAMLNEWMVAIGEKPLKVARRMGKQAFMSADKVIGMIAAFEQDAAKQIESLNWLNAALNWLETESNSGLIEDAIAVCGDLPDNITRKSIALGMDASLKDKAAYLAHINEADAADIVLLTHHYLSAKALYNPNIMPYAALVVDEADLIVDVIDDMASHDLSLMALKRLLINVHPGIDTQQIDELIELTSLQIRHDAIATCMLPADTQSKLKKNASAVLDLVNQVIVSKFGDSNANQDALEDLQRTKKILTEFIKPDGFFVSALTFSPSKGFPSLAVMPVMPGALLRNLWRDESGIPKLFAVMFTSATLGTPNESDVKKAFKHIAGQIGITDNTYQLALTSSWCQYEPESFGKMHVVYPDPMVCSPVIDVDDDYCAVLSDDWVDYACMMIEAASQTIINNNTRTLVLVRSYADCQAIESYLADKLGDKLIIQNRSMGMAAAKRKFMEMDGAVWVSPTAWEGVDMPNTIANLVIFRMPFKGPDALLRALLVGVSKMTDQSADKIVADRSVVLAKRLLRQGLGRGIRTKTDKCVVWIPDTRIRVPQSNSNLIARTMSDNAKYLTQKIKGGTPKNCNWILKIVPRRFENDWNRTKDSPMIFWADTSKKWLKKD